MAMFTITLIKDGKHAHMVCGDENMFNEPIVAFALLRGLLMNLVPTEDLAKMLHSLGEAHTTKRAELEATFKAVEEFADGTVDLRTGKPPHYH